MEEQYEKGEESFFSFGEAYAAGKNDHVIEECIGQLYRFSQSYPWPEEWFSACQKSFEVEREEGLLKEEWLLFLEERIRFTAQELSSMTREALKAASEEGGPYMYEPALNSDLSVQTAIACAEDFPEMCRILASYNPERLSSKKDKTVNDRLRGQVKAVRDYGKKLLQDMKKEYGSFSLEEVLGSIRALKEPMQAVLSLAQAFGQRYYEAKREKNILDFSDVEHLALSVLVKRQEGVNVPSPAALELSGRYEEITGIALFTSSSTIWRYVSRSAFAFSCASFLAFSLRNTSN